MKKFLVFIFALLIFFNFYGMVNALSIHIEPWFTWTVEFDNRSFPGALGVIKSDNNDSLPIALNSDGYQPIYIMTKSCCEEYPNVPKGYYPRWKLIGSEVYEFTNDEYKKLPEGYLEINNEFLFLQDIKLEDLVIKDNRPDDVSPPAAQDISIPAFYEGEQYNITGKIIYSLNPDYKEGAVARAGEAAKRWGEENRRYRYLSIFFVVLFLLFTFFWICQTYIAWFKQEIFKNQFRKLGIKSDSGKGIFKTLNYVAYKGWKNEININIMLWIFRIFGLAYALLLILVFAHYILGINLNNFWQNGKSSELSLNTIQNSEPKIEVVAKQSKENLIFEPLSGKIVTSGYHTDYDFRTNSEGSQIAEKLYLQSDNKQSRIPVPEEIWFKLSQIENSHKSGKKGFRRIVEFVIPIHPENKNIVFISTSEISNSEKNLNINRIFAYNIETYDLVEIYQEEVKFDDLSTAGMEGSKILFVREDANSSPPSCTGIWSPYKAKTHEYLELADIKGGLKSYTVPQYRLDQDEIESQKCLKDFGWQ